MNSSDTTAPAADSPSLDETRVVEAFDPNEQHVHDAPTAEPAAKAAKPKNSKLVYKEGENLAIFLTQHEGDKGPFETFEIADGPKGGPDTKYWSMPARVNGVGLLCDEESRGGEVLDLFRGKQVIIDKKLKNPFEDKVTKQLVEYKPFIVEGIRANVTKGEKTYNKVQLFVADPVFRREDRGKQGARPIGYCIPRQNLTKKDFEGKTQEQIRELYVTVWRKQGERGGKNIFLSVPEAFALRDGKEISREGVTLKMTGIDKGVLQTSAQVEGQGARNQQAQQRQGGYRR